MALRFLCERERRCAEEDAHVIKAPKAVADELIACNKPYMEKVPYCIHADATCLEKMLRMQRAPDKCHPRSPIHTHSISIVRFVR